jgi:sensor histidine kinase regulating citrate/malate metabolism
MKLHLLPKSLKLTECIISDYHTDDGGGMDPDSMRRCMSFGFSDKQSGSSIGQCMCFQLSFITC